MYSVVPIPDNILRRLKAKDNTLVEDLTLDEIAKIYSILQTRQVYYTTRLFIRDFLIPEKTVRNFLTKEEWKSLGVGLPYVDYVAGLLNYFGDKDDREGIEAVRKLILREEVNMSKFVMGYLYRYSPHVLKLLIDFDPKIIHRMFDIFEIVTNIPLLIGMFSYAKDTLPKEYVLDFLDKKLEHGVHYWRNGKPIMAILESGIIDFTDIHNIILKYNRSEDIAWINKIIESQV